MILKGAQFWLKVKHRLLRFRHWVFTLCVACIISEQTNSNPHPTFFLLTHDTADLNRPQQSFDRFSRCTYMYQSSQDCHLYSLPRPQQGAVVFGIWKMTSQFVKQISAIASLSTITYSWQILRYVVLKFTVNATLQCVYSKCNRTCRGRFSSPM